MKIAVIGYGNGGRAFAGYLAALGHHVRVYARAFPATSAEAPLISLEGAVACEGRPAILSSDLAAVVKGCELVLVVTTADAHHTLARQMAPYLEPGQIIVLNPGRTFGAIDFRRALQHSASETASAVVIAEAQSLVFACRSRTDTCVTIVGKKKNVPLAALKAEDTARVVAVMNGLFGCFQPAGSVVETSLENIGAILHPPITLLNAAAIERGTKIYFYKDMTPRIAKLLVTLDRERLAIAGALGLKLRSVEEWVSYAYDGVATGDLCEKMRRNPAYFQILAPTNVECRMITEDVPTGLVPMHELGRLVGVATPMMRSMIQLGCQLLETDYFASGRTLERLGLDGATLRELMNGNGASFANLRNAGYEHTAP